MNPQPRSFKRSVFTSYLDELRSAGLLGEVRARASTELRALLDAPRKAEPWMGPLPLDEINTAVAALGGREAVRRLGFQVMKRGFTTVMEPIIHVSLTLLGASPASLFSRAQLMLAVTSRGVQMEWVANGPASGTMHVVCGELVPPSSWAAWEGCLLYGLELAGSSGTVGEARPAADGHSCEIDVSWTPK